MGLMDLFNQGDVREKLYAAAAKNNVPQGGITGKLFSAMFPHGLGNLAFGRNPEPVPPLETPEGTALMADLASNMMVPGTTSPKALAKMFGGEARTSAGGLLSNQIAEEAMRVYKNKLGVPDPSSSLSPFGKRKIVLSDGREMYNVPGAFSITAASDLPNVRFETGIKNGMTQDEVKSAIENIRELAKKWAIENEFSITVDDVDGYGLPRMEFEHQGTKSAYEDLLRKDAEKWADAQDVYIRYGDVPQGGKSRNARDGYYEDGVSVFRGKYNKKTGEWKIIPETANEVGTMSTLMHRDAYLVDGEHFGTGSDGEPILKNAISIRNLTKNKPIRKK